MAAIARVFKIPRLQLHSRTLHRLSHLRNIKPCFKVNSFHVQNLKLAKSFKFMLVSIRFRHMKSSTP